VLAVGVGHLEIFSNTTSGQIWSMRTDTNGGMGNYYDWAYLNP
jgi:hypothetical protein